MQYIQLKAARASEHLEALQTALQSYYDSVPITTTKIRKPEIGRRILRVDMKDPSDAVYVLAGDFAHNLRSTLDHVVYALIVHATRDLPDTSAVQWPVQIQKDDKAFARQTKDVPAAPLAIIKSLQPYLEGPDPAYKKSLLWQLHKLDIIDKHRRIAINQLSTIPYFPTLTPTSDFKMEVVEHGVEVSFPIDAPPVDMVYDPKPEVLFGDSEEGLNLNVAQFEAIFQYITRDVFPQFEPFLV